MTVKHGVAVLCAGIWMLMVVAGPVSATVKTVKRGQDNIPAEPEVGELETVPLPVMVRVNEDVLKIGEITIDRKERSATMAGEINMSTGIVEYLACSGQGKLHESVLKMDVQPYHIQIALLLLGLEPGNQPIEYQGAAQKPCGDPVRIMVSWQAGNKEVQVRAEELVFNRATENPMEDTIWVFTGSQIVDNRYMAQEEGVIIATFHDPFAIVDHRSDTGADDTLFFANEQRLPPRGTPITLKILVEKDPSVQQVTSCKPGTQK